MSGNRPRIFHIRSSNVMIFNEKTHRRPLPNKWSLLITRVTINYELNMPWCTSRWGGDKDSSYQWCLRCEYVLLFFESFEQPVCWDRMPRAHKRSIRLFERIECNLSFKTTCDLGIGLQYVTTKIQSMGYIDIYKKKSLWIVLIGHTSYFKRIVMVLKSLQIQSMFTLHNY